MTGPLVYLAHPIDNGWDPEPVHQVRTLLVERGCTVFDPARAWSGNEPGLLVQQINLGVVTKADLLVAVLNPKILTIGTVMEITLRQSVAPGTAIVYGPAMRNSLALQFIEVPMVSDLQELIEWLDREDR